MAIGKAKGVDRKRAVADGYRGVLTGPSGNLDVVKNLGRIPTSMSTEGNTDHVVEKRVPMASVASGYRKG